MLHFGYVAHNGSFLDLSEVFVSGAVPGLEVDSMIAVSHWVDGGAKGRHILLTPKAKNLLHRRAYGLQIHLTSPLALHSPLNPTQALQVSQSHPATTSQLGSSTVWNLSSQNDRC